MIYWLNGAYGVGKTTVANRLLPLLRNAHLFDPELVGNGIRDNYPKALFCETYEEYPIWLETNYRMLKDLHARHEGDIVVPMTLLREGSYAAIIQRLLDEGIPMKYVYLDADEVTLKHRMIDSGREEPDSWCVRHIPACLAVQAAETHAVHIPTVGRTPEDIAQEIAALTIN